MLWVGFVAMVVMGSFFNLDWRAHICACARESERERERELSSEEKWEHLLILFGFGLTQWI